MPSNASDHRPSTRGLPNDSSSTDPLAFVGQIATDGSLGSPLALLKRSSLENNARWMRTFAARYGVQIAPHGKTSMAPKIFRMQMEFGAKWLSVANVTQARVARSAGCHYILISNQVVNIHDLAYLARETADDRFHAMCFVDSLEAVELLERAMAAVPRATKFPVLVEVGIPGGRAGVRHAEEALAIARRLKDSPYVSLAGVAGYEGVFTPKDPTAVGKVDAYLDELVDIAAAIDAEKSFGGDVIFLSAGGSKFFDRVAAIFTAAKFSKPTDVMLRCGCYLFHDVGIYEEAMGMLYARDLVAASLGKLVPAIEIWGQIQSIPEARRAIVDIGRRESSYDAGLPVPSLYARPGQAQPIRKLAGTSTARLNDQHCFLDLADESPLRIGDLVGFDISHPCTVFDKWQGVYLVDDDYRILDFIQLEFA